MANAILVTILFCKYAHDLLYYYILFLPLKFHEARNLSLRVHVFEPQPRYAATLSALEERYHGSVRFHAAAAGTSSGTSWLYPATDRQAWSTVAAMARAYTVARTGALRSLPAGAEAPGTADAFDLIVVK